MTSLNSLLTATSLDLLNSDPLSLEPLPPETRQRLLRFPLGLEDSAMLPLEQIAEIIRVNRSDILPVPDMPHCILGIGNWRGEMLWLVDLNHLLGYPSLSGQGQLSTSPTVMVIQANDQYLGLVVQQVYDIELYELEQLQPAVNGLFPRQILPFILGYLPGEKGTVLDVNAIIQYPLWQVHQGKIT